jgi:hypothetical protein
MPLRAGGLGGAGRDGSQGLDGSQNLGFVGDAILLNPPQLFRQA